LRPPAPSFSHRLPPSQAVHHCQPPSLSSQRHPSFPLSLFLLFMLLWSPLSSQRHLAAAVKNRPIVVVAILVRSVMFRTPWFQPLPPCILNPVKFDMTLCNSNNRGCQIDLEICSKVIFISIRFRSSSFLKFSAAL